MSELDPTNYTSIDSSHQALYNDGNFVYVQQIFTYFPYMEIVTIFKKLFST